MQKFFAEKEKKERLNEHGGGGGERGRERERDLTGATHKIIPPHPSGYKKILIHTQILNIENRSRDRKKQRYMNVFTT